MIMCDVRGLPLQRLPNSCASTPRRSCTSFQLRLVNQQSGFVMHIRALLRLYAFEVPPQLSIVKSQNDQVHHTANLPEQL